MADENTNPEDVTDPVDPPTADPPAADPPKDDTDLKAAKREAQNLRARLRTQEAATAAEKTRADELDSKVADLSSKVQRSQVERATVEAARDPQVGAKRPEAIAKLIDMSKVTFDDKGMPTGITEELTRIKSDFPELFHTSGSADGAAGKGDPVDAGDMNSTIRRAAGRA